MYFYTLKSVVVYVMCEAKISRTDILDGSYSNSEAFKDCVMWWNSITKLKVH